MPPMKGWALKQLSWSGGVPTEEKKAPSFLGKIPNPTALPTSPEPERAPQPPWPSPVRAPSLPTDHPRACLGRVPSSGDLLAFWGHPPSGLIGSPGG